MAINDKHIRITVRVPRETYQKFHALTAENAQTKTDVVVRLMEKFVAGEVSLSRASSDAVRRLKA